MNKGLLLSLAASVGIMLAASSANAAPAAAGLTKQTLTSENSIVVDVRHRRNCKRVCHRSGVFGVKKRCRVVCRPAHHRHHRHR
jgi:hypothetical protein